ncbi:hypothetical protein OUZ56_026930 [Daphnia magna]|uniref:Uncharacterized protein n=1 Tax=Daphnia magna TaxID=35525 RepID=A0ABQ9ZNC4_9CRUS|nr:hypothetical protein OUZ56_026930 [Daphnia magna]
MMARATFSQWAREQPPQLNISLAEGECCSNNASPARHEPLIVEFLMLDIPAQTGCTDEYLWDEYLSPF